MLDWQDWASFNEALQRSHISANSINPPQRWMIVLVDNYDRETVADIVKAENLGHADAAAIVDRMQAECANYSTRWPVMRRMGAKLCLGMEDLV